ncbi:hypothetical protein EN851_03395 [Mesorhizobium sp. M8A.F.Ca.ET.208.01.1.1]|uniref:hypothetical protein n=1 Tax=unclassified Mesorhizobium TaxID=325217 RepID=UPI001093A2B5|nr:MULTISPECIES: hypothetical protein [unclassified Mesorhizobium]TGQ94613.1 hypothetical protein EN851_03395 [Mesorhizobium sp. M8A.F.Ca.ET.208.01.1.1]TGT55101.1 hypothetical protein EN810_03395 [Mesorhizobium sp. M8A.F.Ca.ET.167.01.1.1]
MADIASGVFDVVDGALQEIKEAQLPKIALERFHKLMGRAQLREISEDDLEKQAAQIDPKLGLLVKTMRGKGLGFFGAVLLVLMLALSHCQFNVNVSLDINKLVDQAVGHAEEAEEPDLRNKPQDTKGNHERTGPHSTSNSTGSESHKIEHNKAPSRRRSDVNSGRRAALRKRREQFPRRKRRS